MARIAVATFQHETNTFAPSPATMADFLAGGGWPGYCTGEAVFERVAGTNIPIAGFVDEIRRRGHEAAPLVFANATPSATVRTAAFERIMDDLLRSLASMPQPDAIYLDLHGAMVTDAHDDGEGECLRRIRALVGDRIPIVASLDLHANVSASMVARTDGLVAFRTYPHVDMARTGWRAATLLDAILARGDRPAKEFRQLDFLIPLTSQCTLIEPAAGLYDALAAAEETCGGWLSMATGFPAADVACCGPSILGYGFDAAALARETHALAARAAEAEAAFRTAFLAPRRAIEEAVAIARTAQRPVVLADTQDNPGAGGNGDTTGILAELVAQDATRALLGLLIDPAAAALAHKAGIGATIDVSLGAKSGLAGHHPVDLRAEVVALSDGAFLCTGPFYGGSRMALGPMAALRHRGVTVVVASRKVQAADQEMFRHLGLDPAAFGIVVLKSAVHFRAHFQPIAERVMVVAAPGPMAADPAVLPWSKLRPGIRLGPLGASFAR
jgi:microcystin degradation protein MlrC